eukprot:Cvel_8194.t1-p1 / transcript=Cvel_8194.t1 / gene=Cvel_8194 / organism=Chromera_velia_CCMP2878 / gene_product=tRNA pseudouridine synthase 1, putative / transcript_product=tRNA pseudouridine synthase 1, putative / location=Cvel_scaffold446:80290-81069(+) / protein_length=260 / sequence_SO=supercontig / SO=protein_coding / is_pseudo=false
MPSKEEVERFQKVLKKFEGTHRFHNFTQKIAGSDGQAQRYVIGIKTEIIEVAYPEQKEEETPDVHMSSSSSSSSASAAPAAAAAAAAASSFSSPPSGRGGVGGKVGGQPRGGESVRFIRITLEAQSFLLHQIRKMICLALEECRGSAPSGAIEKALQPSCKAFVRLVPGEGLLLTSLGFGAFNEHKAAPIDSFPIIPDLGGSKLAESVCQFKESLIYPEIATLEGNGLWQHFLDSLDETPFLAMNPSFGCESGGVAACSE